jgi:hypothetical protein
MLPLSLIPTFLMPLFTILHIAALIKVAKIPIPGKQQLRAYPKIKSTKSCMSNKGE